jgi:hypothetical protein
MNIISEADNEYYGGEKKQPQTTLFIFLDERNHPSIEVKQPTQEDQLLLKMDINVFSSKHDR